MFLYAVIIGAFSGAIFVVIQPLFGMETITSRHASAYVSQGGYTLATATLIAWTLHTLVSVVYALALVMIVKIKTSIGWRLAQIAGLGWISTVVATPANVFAIKAITTLSFPDFSSLPALNMEMGAKLWLHVIFFVLVLLSLYLADFLVKQHKSLASR